MQEKKDVFNAVTDAFCSDGYYFENVRFEIPDGFLKTIKRDFELIVFNSRKIIFFAKLPENESAQAAVPALRAALNFLVNKFSVSINSFVVCGSNSKTFMHLNKYNDKLSVFNKTSDDVALLFDLLESEVQFGPEIFNYEHMKQLSDVLILSSVEKKPRQKQLKIKMATDGTVYVRKHGTWWEASAVNTDEFYTIAALTGMIGGHQFYQRKFGKGILYFLTFGLFGFGWFFDCLEIYIGAYRDTTGRYLLPLSNKKTGLVLFLTGVGILCLIVLLMSFVFNFLFNTFTETLFHLN